MVSSGKSLKDSIIITHANAPRGSGIPQHWAEENERNSSTASREHSNSELDSKRDVSLHSQEEPKNHTEKEPNETLKKRSIQDSIFISHANAPEGSGIPKHWPTEEEHQEPSKEQDEDPGKEAAVDSPPRRSIKDSFIITHANAPHGSGIPRHWPDE
ncbi:hypothetical protein K7432_009360 [Basidiobolus ranarum]|uniref:Uncharacterized protein n=1 Tax=Basidiobolus ranarum TaxID=34480 RepID=A0ABR2WQF6_9FUNG